MSSLTSIEWCDSTFNPWIGCTKISPACDNCYAAVSTPARTQKIEWGAGKPRKRTSESNWKQPVVWNAAPFFACDDCSWRGDNPDSFQSESTDDPVCPLCKGLVFESRRRVFCASLSDVFDNEVDDLWRTDLFLLIRNTPNIDWLLLTKRIGNVPMLAPRLWLRDGFPANVWLGITVCDQQEAERDIPKLMEVPARVRFLSIEPMLGHIDIRRFMWPVHASWPAQYKSCEEAIADGAEVSYHRQKLVFANRVFIDWVICGGESGQSARTMHPSWVRSLRDQCEKAGTPFLFKQWGEFQPTAHCEEDCALTPWAVHTSGAVELTPSIAFRHLAIQTPEWAGMCRVGKKKAGRLLDGRTWDQYPEVSNGSV